MSKAIYAQFNEADRFCGLIAAASVGDEVKLAETNVHGQQERVWYVPDATKPGYCLAWCGEDHVITGEHACTLIRFGDDVIIDHEALTSLAQVVRSQGLTPEDLICSCGRRGGYVGAEVWCNMCYAEALE
jgi:hypothetical protein